MSVIKAKRKPTPFKVITNFMELRKAVTELVYHNFKYESRDGDDVNFCRWYIQTERECVMKLLQEIGRYLIMANSIFPAFSYEYEHGAHHAQD